MITAFQASAFQNNAFQIGEFVVPPVPQAGGAGAPFGPAFGKGRKRPEYINAFDRIKRGQAQVATPPIVEVKAHTPDTKGAPLAALMKPHVIDDDDVMAILLLM